jgi:hypothetical protein
MTDIDPTLKSILDASEDGRHDESLRLVLDMYAQICRDEADDHGRHFITMFTWDQLAEVYPPARAALADARDDHVKRLLAGDTVFSVRRGWPRSRFQEITNINTSLDDDQSTYEVFVRLKAVMPEIAQREHFLALPAIVHVGDFALAEQYMPDPLRNLERLNGYADELPLFPARPAAPRLAAELSNFAKDVRLRAAILTGTGRATEAEAMQQAVLTGIRSDEMRTFAEREIVEPGTITRELTARQGDPG